MTSIALVTTGANQLATDLVSAAKWKYAAWGTSNTTPAIGQTNLVAELQDPAGGRQSGTVSSGGSGIMQSVVTITATAVSNGQTIQEAALFDASAWATYIMLIRGIFTGIPVSTGDSIQFTFKLTINATTA